MVIWISLLAFVSTFTGGLFSLRYKAKLYLILGFTSGVLLGVVAFDILPEIIRLVDALKVDPEVPMLALVAGFLVFHMAEKFLLIHHAQEASYLPHTHPTVGVLSAVALAGHSFLDGIGIGLGFQVSSSVGILITIAVIAHDFSDGMNTVSLVLTHRNVEKTALLMLVLDAVAPVLGAASTLLFSLPDMGVMVYLGFFAGFLLYIGAADILPEAHREHSSVGLVLLTILGAGFIYLVTRAF